MVITQHCQLWEDFRRKKKDPSTDVLQEEKVESDTDRRNKISYFCYLHPSVFHMGN